MIKEKYSGECEKNIYCSRNNAAEKLQAHKMPKQKGGSICCLLMIHLSKLA